MQRREYLEYYQKTMIEDNNNVKDLCNPTIKKSKVLHKKLLLSKILFIMKLWVKYFSIIS